MKKITSTRDIAANARIAIFSSLLNSSASNAERFKANPIIDSFLGFNDSTCIVTLFPVLCQYFLTYFSFKSSIIFSNQLKNIRKTIIPSKPFRFRGDYLYDKGENDERCQSSARRLIYKYILSRFDKKVKKFLKTFLFFYFLYRTHKKCENQTKMSEININFQFVKRVFGVFKRADIKDTRKRRRRRMTKEK